MDGYLFAFILFGLFIFFVVLLVVLADCFDKLNRQHAMETHAEKLKRLRREREVLRLSNEIDDTREWAALRPLRIEAAKSRLSGRADKGMIDWIVQRQALQQLLGQGPRAIDGNPLGTARAALLEAIEARKADGEETGELEQIVRALDANS